MTTNRRGFLTAGAVAAVGAAAAHHPITAASRREADRPLSASPFSMTMQLSGMMMHAGWPPVSPNDPYLFRGWDALLVQSGHHTGEIKIALANVKDAVPNQAHPLGYTVDRTNPDVGVWQIDGLDVLVRIDGNTEGPVRGVVQPWADLQGRMPACPRTDHPDDYLDIRWLAQTDALIAAAHQQTPNAPKDGTIKEAFKSGPDGANVTARVRLAAGSVAGARPSVKAFEDLKLGFKYTAYPYEARFATDLVRYTSAQGEKIELVLSPKSGDPLVLSLQPAGDVRPFVRVEHHDHKLADRILDGTLTRDNFWHHHFAPYYRLLNHPPTGDVQPSLECCPGHGGCNPPLYCIPPFGRFA